ncbi:YbjN domain-containing protein [Planococcus rifietoensis]|uniref:YbjN domain-containing protein n=1 Tax=Planococcus rifietoensis TaxID=200991 RepID=UPI00384DA931
MPSNVNAFRNCIKEKELFMEEGKNEDGSIFFRVEQRLDNGGLVVLAVSFDESEEIVEIYTFNIAEINDAYKKESTIKLINELNRDYRYSKFQLDENGKVSSSYALMFEDNFNPNIVVRQLVMALNSAEEVYPKFMKLVWS